MKTNQLIKKIKSKLPIDFPFYPDAKAWTEFIEIHIWD